MGDLLNVEVEFTVQLIRRSHSKTPTEITDSWEVVICEELTRNDNLTLKCDDETHAKYVLTMVFGAAYDALIKEGAVP